MHVMSFNVHVNPQPFLSSLKLFKIPRLHLMIPVASPDLIPQLLYWIEIRAYKTKADCLASAHPRWPRQVIGRSELI